ncbi:hypothetical protein LCGC14_1012600 [marine sediment metagenome]|uniref:Uncharacterized protein n=1 Tax=marine sediment metagenome TaxID=412755 RepID=A0A0F9MZW9_9ZZZZ
MSNATLAPKVTQQDAAIELLKRRAARSSLLNFAQYTVLDYQTPSHIQKMAEALEAVECGEITRLMVFMPPRHGKSLLISQIFPCWALGRNPRLEITQSGYSHSLTVEHSRDARDIFVTPEMGRLFAGVRHKPGREGQRSIATERQTASEWGTVQGGRYYATGIGGTLTGRGSDIAIIDDPVKNREEANSPRIRKKTIDWYRSTLYTRLSPSGAVILVMTRWHPGDLAGILLKEMESGDGDEFVIIKLRAIDADNNALWPSQYPLERLESIRKVEGSREWESLYQQNPSVQAGNMFMVDNAVSHSTTGHFPNCQYVRFWDLASTAKERVKDDPDYTVGALVGVTKDEAGLPVVWVPDMVAGQWEAPRRDAVIIQTAKDDGPGVRQCIESVGGYKDAYTTLKEILRGKSSVKKVTVSSEKVVRAGPLEPVFEAGNFHIARGKWTDYCIQQFREFPEGNHDDFVDSIAGGYAELKKPQPQLFDRSVLGI